MQEIKCPKCGEIFQVDESGYAAIVKQVRDKEFSKEIKTREIQFETDKDNAVHMAKLEAEKETALNNLDIEYAIELDNGIIKIKDDYQKAQKEAIEFNNNVEKLKAQYKLDKEKQ